MSPKLLAKRLKNRKHINANVYLKKYNSTGIYRGSVVWNYYLKRKKRFNELFAESHNA